MVSWAGLHSLRQLYPHLPAGAKLFRVLSIGLDSATVPEDHIERSTAIAESRFLFGGSCTRQSRCADEA